MLRRMALAAVLLLAVGTVYAGPPSPAPEGQGNEPILEQLTELNQEGKVSDELLAEAPDWLEWSREADRGAPVGLLLRLLAEGQISEEEFRDSTDRLRAELLEWRRSQAAPGWQASGELSDEDVVRLLHQRSLKGEVSEALAARAADWLEWARDSERTNLPLMLKLLAQGRIDEEEFDEFVAPFAEEFYLEQIQRAWDRWAFAMNVADYGRAHGSIEALILAARLLKDEGVRRVELRRSTDYQGGMMAQKTPPTIAPAALLAEATELAEGRPALGEFVTIALEQVSNQTPTGGADFHGDVVRGDATHLYRIEFQQKRPALVMVFGDGDTDLDLYIYDDDDESEEAIDSDMDMTDRCICWWTPQETGLFRIEVRNWGEGENAYTLVVTQ